MKIREKKMTVRMLEALIDCHKQQMANGERPCTYKISSTMGALYNRKFVDVKAFRVQGHQVMGFYITQKGIDFLMENADL